jgi:hypothetical protein
MLLLTGNGKNALEVRLRFRGVRLRRFQRDFACHPMDLNLEPFVLGFFHGNASGGPPGSSYTFSGVLFSIAVNTEMSALRSLSGRKCEGKNDGSNVPSK